MDRLDPHPVPAAPAPPESPERHIGDVEEAVQRDLSHLPDDLRRGGIAATALRLAQDLDRGLVTGRDAAGHGREIRMCLAQLRDWAPGENKGDQTDEVRQRREQRMGAAAG